MLLKNLDIEILRDFSSNIVRQMNELGLTEEDDIEIILDEQKSDYPRDLERLYNEWLNGGCNSLIVGDKVTLKYTMNTDVVLCGFAYRGASGTIKSLEEEFGEYSVLVNFDSDELSDDYYWNPYSFEKI